MISTEENNNPGNDHDDDQYLNRQMLSTRTRLLGNGIVCGLEFYTDRYCHVQLSKGCGLTSKGHLLCMPEVRLRYHGVYPDPDDYFAARITGEHPVFELFPLPGQGRMPLTPQTLDESAVDPGQQPAEDAGRHPRLRNLEHWVLLLYLEEAIPESGQSGTWSSEGRIVPVLLHQSDVIYMMRKSGELQERCIIIEEEDEELGKGSLFRKDELTSEAELYNAVHKNLLLDDIQLRRFGYGSLNLSELAVEEEEIYPDLPEADTLFLKVYSEYNTLIEQALDQLNEGLGNLHQYFEYYLDRTHIRYVNAFLRLLSKRRADYLDRTQQAGHISIQYFYDFVEDLIETYNELRAELCELVAECQPDEARFPRHLMLGKLQEEITFQLSIFRNYFRQPPIYNDNADRLQKVRFLHWRMVIMIKSFFIPDPRFDQDLTFDDPSDEQYADVLKSDDLVFPDTYESMPVKVTPSRPPSEPLGRQAIPFYYHLSRSYYSLQHYWDYEMTKCNKEDHHYSYHASYAPDSYTQLDHVIQPFAFKVEDYPFYRIEGHIGKTVFSSFDEDGEPQPGVLRRILSLRNRLNLSFDVIAMPLSQLDQLYDHLLFEKDQPDSPAEVEFAGWLEPKALELIKKRGLEHLGGVPKGGTFVLVYDQEETGNDETIVADFSLPFYCCQPDQFQIDDQPPLVRLWGQVLDCLDHEPLPTGEVIRLQFGSLPPVTVAGSDFEIFLLPGNYPIKVIAENYNLHEPVMIEVEDNLPYGTGGDIPEKEVNIYLESQFVTVYLVVTLEGGFPLPVVDRVALGDSDDYDIIDRDIYEMGSNRYPLTLPVGKQTIIIHFDDPDREPVELGFKVDPCKEMEYKLDIDDWKLRQVKIEGLVTSCYDEAPLDGVTIQIGDETILTGETPNEAGRYEIIAFLPVGENELTVSKEGFETQTETVIIPAEPISSGTQRFMRVVEHDIEMKPSWSRMTLTFNPAINSLEGLRIVLENTDTDVVDHDNYVVDGSGEFPLKLPPREAVGIDIHFLNEPGADVLNFPIPAIDPCNSTTSKTLNLDRTKVLVDVLSCHSEEPLTIDEISLIKLEDQNMSPNGLISGRYEVPRDLLPGVYRLIIEAEGFEKTEKEIIINETGQPDEITEEVFLRPLTVPIWLILTAESGAIMPTLASVMLQGETENLIEERETGNVFLLKPVPTGQQTFVIQFRMDLDAAETGEEFEDLIALTITVDPCERMEYEIDIDNLNLNLPSSLNVPPPGDSDLDSSVDLLDRIGIATTGETNDLTKIKGIGEITERKLNSVGIFTYAQVSRMTEADYAMIEKELKIRSGTAKRNDWAGDARKLL